MLPLKNLFKFDFNVYVQNHLKKALLHAVALFILIIFNNLYLKNYLKGNLRINNLSNNNSHSKAKLALRVIHKTAKG